MGETVRISSASATNRRRTSFERGGEGLEMLAHLDA